MDTDRRPTAQVKAFARRNEAIGGGFFVFRRGKRTGRIAHTKFPFEHATFAQALAEATRLAAQHPGESFEVFQTTGALAVSASSQVQEIAA